MKGVRICGAAAFACVYVLFGGSVFASEIDTFSIRRDLLKDSSEPLNEYLNDRLNSAIRSANRSSGSRSLCDADRLRYFLAFKISLPLKSQMESYVLEHPELVSQQRFKLEESVYRDFTFLNLIDYLPIGKIGSALNIGNHFVGSDKFGHMHTEGFFYYLDIYKDGDGVEEILKHSINMERYMFGYATTGVFSWGDLSANFNGIRFFNDIVGEGEDLIGQPAGPYAECRSGEWVQIKDIDIRHYVDEAMDETVNCSGFSSEKLLNKFNQRVAESGAKLGIADFKCEMSADVRNRLEDKYGALAKFIINPKSEAYADDAPGLKGVARESFHEIHQKFHEYREEQKRRLLRMKPAGHKPL